jgi:polysaccharide biosynthesis protein PslE
VLLKSYSVAPLRKSNIIQIDCRGPSSRWTQAVVGKIVDLYQEEHIRLNRPQGSLEFFAEQTERCRRDLSRNENELRDLKTATGLSSPAEQRQALVARIGRLRDELLQAEAARIVSHTRVQTIRPQLAAVPAQHVTSQTAGFGHEATDGMRQALYALEVKKEAAAARYTAAHPHMQQIREQLGASSDIVGRQEPARTQVTTGTNRVHEEVQLALMIEEPVLASLEAKAGTLREQLARVSGELKSLNDNELQIAKLQREVELQQATYRKYAANLEQARIDQALETQRMSNISVAQPATLEPLAVSPRKATRLGLGIVAGLLGAFATAMIASWRDHTFHAPADLQRELKVPVLGSLPRLTPKEVRLAGNGKL